MTSPVKLNVTLDKNIVKEDPFCKDVFDIIKVSKPSWCSDERFISNLESKVLSGGVANHLVAYYEKGNLDDALILKMYGKGMEIMVNRSVENDYIQILHKAGRCPPLYTIFNNGIVYGYTPGAVLDKETIREKVVQRAMIREIVQFNRVLPVGQCDRSEMWDIMDKLLEHIPEGFDDPEKHRRYIECITSKANLRKEVGELKSHLAALNSPVVFCHNDLLFGNTIYNKTEERITFIDFEWAWPNYEHFELGNHFCEYASMFEVDYERLPDQQYQREWLRMYLEEKHKVECGETAEHGEDKVSDKDGVKNTGVDVKQGDCGVSDRALELYLVKANKFSLAAHMLWGLCCTFLSSMDRGIDFDFFEYAILRLQQYFRTKDALLAMKLPE